MCRLGYVIESHIKRIEHYDVAIKDVKEITSQLKARLLKENRAVQNAMDLSSTEEELHHVLSPQGNFFKDGGCSMQQLDETAVRSLDLVARGGRADSWADGSMPISSAALSAPADLRVNAGFTSSSRRERRERRLLVAAAVDAAVVTGGEDPELKMS
ncbi:unnamed protein product [Lampetra fluviatilis]